MKTSEWVTLVVAAVAAIATVVAAVGEDLELDVFQALAEPEARRRAERTAAL